MIEPVTITLSGITAHGRHGVLAAETELGQKFVVDVELTARVETQADVLDQTINYAEVADLVVAQITGEPVQLVETLAGRIATQILLDERVERCLVRVHKPQAPIRHCFGDVTVTLVRCRGDAQHG